MKRKEKGRLNQERSREAGEYGSGRRRRRSVRLQSNNRQVA
jgi:hypothetical protein